jgi:5-methyltetrahydrofolate--homocysteine methyltransferase
VIYVTDASRSVNIASEVLRTQTKEAFAGEIKSSYERIREGFARKTRQLEFTPLEDARSRATRVEKPSPTPKELGLGEVKNASIDELRKWIDWSPFFLTWQLHGRFPNILEDAVVGEEARKLYADAQAMLDKMDADGVLNLSGRYGLFPTHRDGDDLILSEQDERLIFLRQQHAPYRALSDFIGQKDHIGLFAVQAGDGLEEYLGQIDIHDDYHRILAKALADRLAEAMAEYLHHLIRTDFWGYASDESLSTEEIISEKYKGIRPAPGYPACPDHLEKETIFRILRADEIGMKLTESMAMEPAAAVAGYYFAHEEAAYFALGKIDRDQIQDYAKRRNISEEEAIRWLRPIIGFEL